MKDVLQFATMLVLVRMLEPAAYGQFALVTALTGMFTVFSFRSFLEHTLQLRPGEDPDYANHFAIGGLVQLVPIAGMHIAATILSLLPRYAAVAPLVRVMSLLFVLDWMAELRVKMLERDLDWPALRICEGIGLVLSTACALAMAFAGAGVYALLVPGLLRTLPFIYDLFVRAAWRPRLAFSFDRYRASFHYGLTRIGSGTVITGRQLAESTMLAQFAGFAAAGIFGRAMGLASLACMKAPSMLVLMLYPVLSRIEPRSEASRRAAALVLRGVAWSVIPLGALVILIHEPVVRILYGAKWMAAAPLVPLAVLAAGFAALANAAGILLLSNIDQRKCLYGDLIGFAGVMLSLFLLLPRGMNFYLAGLAVSNAASAAAMIWWLHRAEGLNLASLNDVFGPPLAAAIVVAAPAVLVVNLIPAVILSVAFLCAYVVLLRTIAGSSLGEIFHYCPGGGRLRRLLWIGV